VKAPQRNSADPAARGAPSRTIRGALRLGLWAGLFALQSGVARAASITAESILGRWLVDDEEAVVEIYRCAAAFCGRIAWLKEPLFPPDDDGGMASKPKTDRNNPVAARRSDPILGSTVLRDLQFTGSDWEYGRLYDPETGHTYTSRARLAGANRLVIRGYLGFSLFGRTAVWTRLTQNG